MRPALRVLAPALLALAACESGSARATDTAAAAPKVDLAAEEQAIRDLDARWARAVAAKDTAAISALYATDALLMPPNAQPLGGRAGAQKGWNAMLSAPGASMTFGPTRIVVASSGDMAYDIGTYTARRGSTEDRGKYLVVWKKQDGQWKVAADMFNSDLPAR